MRKGKYFITLVMLFYILASIAAIVVISSQFLDRAPIEGKAVGEYQGALLNAEERVSRKQFYARAAAKKVLKNARKELYGDPRAFFTSQKGDAASAPCGAYGYQLFDCIDEQILTSTFRMRTEELLDEELRKYPGGFYTQYSLAEDREKSPPGFFDFTADLEEPILLKAPPGEESGEAERHFKGLDVATTLSWPMVGSKTITSCFGPRILKQAKSDKHHGIDIRAGSSVVAAADGVVINTPPGTEGTVWIKHSNSLSTRYLHLTNILVKKGDVVKRGQPLGTPGETGCPGCGAHLHFEVLVPEAAGQHAYPSKFTPGWVAVNPVCFLPELTAANFDAGATKSCFRSDAPQPPQQAYCGEYGLALEPAVAHQPGTAIRKRQEGEEGPPTTADVEAARPDASGLTHAQQEKFQLTEQRRYEYGWDKYVIKAATEEGVDQALLLGLITQESVGDPLDISSTGCAGLMQICFETANHLSGLKGHITKCDCSGKGESCRCAPENDRRLVPEFAVPAGAALLKQNLDEFSNAKEKETQWAFALAAYNGGPGVVRRAIHATGKPQPSWDEVAKELKKNPEMYPTTKHFNTLEKKRDKMKEITDYVDNVLAFARAWNGGLSPVSGKSVESTKIGDYELKDSFSLPRGLDGELEVLEWAKRTISACAQARAPGDCLIGAAKKEGFLSACDGDEEALSLYEDLRDCAENRQYDCRCILPQPVEAEVSFSLADGWDARVGNLFLQEPFGKKSPRVAVDGEPEGVLPENLSFSNGALAFSYGGDRLLWPDGWSAEKNSEGNLIFREDASGAPACAPVKREYTFCKAVEEGAPAARFALTLRDDKAPSAEVIMKQGGGEEKVLLLLKSPDPDVSFYNVYDRVPASGVKPRLQLPATSTTSFDAEPFKGSTLYVTAVDKAGNEGLAVSIPVGKGPS